MKKVVTIHLSGKLFQIEEDAYQKLDRTLSQIRLKDTIGCEATEAKLAELFNNRAELGQKVITFQMVYEILRDQGLLNNGNNGKQEKKEPYQRLYRQTKDKVIGGVCSGLGQYWSTDPILLRLLFVVLFFGFGTGLLLYIIMWIVIPKAT
jgi:phage shock protein PspC (stress-responsive transcriptional regulator)